MAALLPLLARRVADAGPRRKLEISGLCGDAVRELGAGADAELAVDARQRRLDRVLREEERRRNFAVRAALGDEHGDPPLRLRQLVARRCPAADPCELGPRLLGPERRAQLLEGGACLLERRAGGAATLRAALRPAEREQRARAMERVGRPVVFGERSLEALERALEPAGALLPRLEDLVGLGELADRDQRLEQVSQLHPLRRLEHDRIAELVRAPQVR